jgi:hypothetical protein
MNHYVAYHNSEKMGHSFRSSDKVEPHGTFSVVTNRRTDNLVGGMVWMISGSGDGGSSVVSRHVHDALEHLARGGQAGEGVGDVFPPGEEAAGRAVLVRDDAAKQRWAGSAGG